MSKQQEQLPVGVRLLNGLNFKNLTQFDKTNILELNKLSNEATNIAEKFLKDLNFFSKMAFDPFEENLLEESFTEEFSEIKNTATDIFDNTILKTTKKIANDLEKELQNKSCILFNGFLASASIQILETIIDFEKTIDKLFPNTYKKIIQGLGNGLVGLIGIYSPTIGILLKVSGIVDKASNFLSCDNLMIKVLDLKNKIRQIEQNKKLRKIYITGMQVGTLSKITGLSTISLSNLGLQSESLVKITGLLQKNNLDEKIFIQNIVEMLELIPNNKEELNRKFQILKESLIEIVKEQNLPETVQKAFESKINNAFKDIITGYSPILNSNKSVFEKLVYQEEASSRIIEFTKEFKHNLVMMPNSRNIESNITTKFVTLVQKHMNVNSAKLLQQATKLPIIAKELGLNVQTKIFLERLIPKTLGI